MQERAAEVDLVFAKDRGASPHEAGRPPRPTGLRRLAALDPREAEFARRGFPPCEPSAQGRLEAIGRAFIAGYGRALADANPPALLRFAEEDGARRGFVMEGAAMGAAIADALSWRGARLGGLLAQAGPRYGYLLHVGAGWAMARLPWRRGVIRRALDPVHHWLADDGMGFHDLYFHHGRVLAGWRRVRGAGYAPRAYAQGLGRALWFLGGADPQAVRRLVAAMPQHERADLWSGVGLACAYAGGADPQALAALAATLPADARAGFRQGCAFAAEAHACAGPAPAHAAAVIRALLGAEPAAVAALVRAERARLDASAAGPTPPYERWRRAVQRRLDGLPGDGR
ncbi:DUF1702 family protein [Salinarimonas sp.]|uniref:DUF1702 family protein n=1 Tax=Salinarimonas sp. TaxID=2766526 RepID=UPI0032D8D494